MKPDVRVGANKHGEQMISAWIEAVETLKRRKTELANMEAAVTNAARDVAAWATPKALHVKCGESYCFWVGGCEDTPERLLSVSMDGSVCRVTLSSFSQGGQYTDAETAFTAVNK